MNIWKTAKACGTLVFPFTSGIALCVDDIVAAVFFTLFGGLCLVLYGKEISDEILWAVRHEVDKETDEAITRLLGRR